MSSKSRHSSSGSLKAAFWLNLVFTLIEIAGGLYTNSVAILSDAIHDLGDSLSLGLAWLLQNLSRKKRDTKFTYGYGRFSLLGAFISSTILILGSVFILSEAIPRLFDPPSPDTTGMFFLALLGIGFNGLGYFKLRHGHSMNEKMAAWHLVEDLLGWVAVLVGSLVMMVFYLPILDPILSLFITAFILFKVFKNYWKTISIFLQAKPDKMEVGKIEKSISRIPGVESVHDIHLWSMDGDYSVMTMHVVVPDETSSTDILRIKELTREKSLDFNIRHLTIEIEFLSEKCQLADC